MRTIIHLWFMFALTACELYTPPDEADDAPPAAELSAVDQCRTLVAAFCDGLTSCGYAGNAEGCAADLDPGRCDVNQTVIPPGLLIAHEVDLRGRACDGSPTWAQWIAGSNAAPVMGAMLRW